MVARNIDINNVSISEGSGVRDTMANNFIDRCTARSWESIVIKRRWISIMSNYVIVNNFINFFSSNTWFNSSVCSIDSSSSNYTRSSGFCNFLLTMNWSVFISNFLETSIWHGSLSIIWFLDRIWNCSMSNKTIREWSHWPSISKATFNLFISLFVT
jgi:hypothetical protein